MKQPHSTRRSFLGAVGAAGLAGVATTLTGACATPSERRSAPGRLRQAVAGWCFMNQGPKWDLETLARTAAQLGCDALELIDAEHWDLLRDHGLVCAATKSHSFVRGPCHRGHWAECREKLTDAIKVTAAAGFPNVMTFTGFGDTTGEPNGGLVQPEEGLENCIEFYRGLADLAERSGVAMVLEPLNTRDAAPMKGHPGYLGDHVDECMEIIRAVNSPGLRLLFDVYHVQIMDGDLIRRIGELHEFIGHVQLAGCPGRGPLGGDQEIHYPAVMRALADCGYDRFISHEWIATGDARTQLKESIAACTV